jgi:hypothetical protein
MVFMHDMVDESLLLKVPDHGDASARIRQKKSRHMSMPGF